MVDGNHMFQSRPDPVTQKPGVVRSKPDYSNVGRIKALAVGPNSRATNMPKGPSRTPEAMNKELYEIAAEITKNEAKTEKLKSDLANTKIEYEKAKVDLRGKLETLESLSWEDPDFTKLVTKISHELKELGSVIFEAGDDQADTKTSLAKREKKKDVLQESIDYIQAEVDAYNNPVEVSNNPYVSYDVDAAAPSKYHAAFLESIYINDRQAAAPASNVASLERSFSIASLEDPTSTPTTKVAEMGCYYADTDAKIQPEVQQSAPGLVTVTIPDEGASHAAIAGVALSWRQNKEGEYPIIEVANIFDRTTILKGRTVEIWARSSAGVFRSGKK